MSDDTSTTDPHGTEPQRHGLTLFETATVLFDAADPTNGSLYLCDPGGGDASVLEPAIAVLRAHGLWSSAEPKRVRDEQRAAYREQLRLVAERRLPFGAADLVLLQCDHPKFPSSAARYERWVRTLEAAAGGSGACR